MNRNPNNKKLKYTIIVAFFLIFLFLIYHFSHNQDEEIILPNFLIDTNATVVVTDVPIDSNANATARQS